MPRLLATATIGSRGVPAALGAQNITASMHAMRRAFNDAVITVLPRPRGVFLVQAWRAGDLPTALAHAAVVDATMRQSLDLHPDDAASARTPSESPVCSPHTDNDAPSALARGRGRSLL